MANEIRASYDTGATLYALVFRADGQVWDQTLDGANGDWTPFDNANLVNYDVVLTEIDDDTDDSGQYRGTFPPNIVSGDYSVVLYLQVGGGPVWADDVHIGLTTTMYWDTSANIEITLSSMDTVLDTIAVDVAGVNGITPPAAGAIEAYILSDVIGADGDTLEILSDQLDGVQTDTTAILVDVTGINGEAMRGTDGVSLVVPDVAGVVAAYILSDVIGADSDTLETLSDQLDVLGAGSGGTMETYTVTDSVTGFGIDGVHVWVTSDIGGANIIWAGFTNAAGVVNYYHDLATGTTVYLWREIAGYTFSNPDSEVTS